MLKRNIVSPKLLQGLIITGILVLIAVFIFLLPKISFVFLPIQALLSLLFIPFLIAGFLYYIFKPILALMEKHLKIKKKLGIWIVFLLSFIFISFIISIVLPKTVNQLTGLINASASNIANQQAWFNEVFEDSRFKDFAERIDLYSQLNDLNLSYTKILENVLVGLTGSIGSLVSMIADLVMILIMIPIFLYYMLADGEKFIPFVKNSFLKHDKWNLISLLEKINFIMSKYVSGTIFDASLVFFAALIFYIFLGIPSAFLFALIAAVFNLIPYVGPYIGVLPLILTTVWTQPVATTVAVIYVLVVQQLDANLIQPRIIGNAVKIHPLTVMVLMMLAGSLYGVVAMIVAIPFYAVVKEIVKFFSDLYWAKREGKEDG